MQFSRHLPILVAAVALIVVVIIFAVPPTVGRDWPAWTGLRGKTLWDFAELIVVPISLALIAYLFSATQRAEEREIARAQRQQDQDLADQRRHNDLEIASNREQEAALQSYLTVMTDLVLKQELRDRISTIAQARTFSVLSGLDGRRRAQVLRFLAGTRLIGAQETVVSLSGADLSNMPAEGINLTDCSLMGANLSNSRLNRCSLRNSDLRSCDLTNVDLSNADLFGADLRATTLDQTIFAGTLIYKADFSPPPERPHMSMAVQRNRAQRAEQEWLDNLGKARFNRARYDYSTKWPAGFKASETGAINESD